MISLATLKIGVYGSVFALSLAMTYLIATAGEKLHLLDHPNGRSSHSTPKPRGGGLAFILAFFLGALILWSFGALSGRWLWPLLIGGLPVALVGFIDDLKSLSAKARLLTHFASALAAYYLLTSGFSTQVDISFLPGDGGDILEIGFAVLFIAWMVNLYNFMDGIDGLAATQAVVVACMSAGLCAWQGNWGLFSLYVLLAVTVFGFLLFNWAPAKVFMGDCGAYFLGFAFACLALMSKIYVNQSLIAHMILLGVFISDATYTLLLRLLQKKKLYQAHKDHGFQHFVSKGRSHQQVALIWNGITLCWLGPMAILATLYTDYSWPILVVSYLPLLGLMIYLQAGVEWSVGDLRVCAPKSLSEIRANVLRPTRPNLRSDVRELGP